MQKLSFGCAHLNLDYYNKLAKQRIGENWLSFPTWDWGTKQISPVYILLKHYLLIKYHFHISPLPKADTAIGT